MANSTSASLKLTVQATGENSGTWGQITNTNLLILEQAIGGYEAVGITSGATLTFSNGAISNGKNHNYTLSECSKESGQSVLDALNLIWGHS